MLGDTALAHWEGVGEVLGVDNKCKMEQIEGSHLTESQNRRNAGVVSAQFRPLPLG